MEQRREYLSSERYLKNNNKVLEKALERK